MFSKALDEGKEIRVIFFDISKAFDRVSAKSLIGQFTSSTISLINMRNNKGPKMDPCGTPALTVFQDDSFPFVTTLCFLLVK
jgi:hypothetical protein